MLTNRISPIVTPKYESKTRKNSIEMNKVENKDKIEKETLEKLKICLEEIRIATNKFFFLEIEESELK